MKTLTSRVLRCAGITVLCVAASCFGASRPITITVTARTEAGTTLESVPLSAGGALSGKFGLTDETGRVVLLLNEEDGEEVSVHLSDALIYSIPLANRALAEEKYKQYRATLYFPMSTDVVVAPGQDAFDVELVASPAIAVRMFPSDGSGFARAHFVGVTGGAFADAFAPPTPCVIRGVKKNAPAEIVLQWVGSPQAHIIHLSAEQTAADLDLGVRELIDTPRTVDASVTMTNRIVTYTPGGYPFHDAITLIRDDGGLVVNLPIFAATGMMVENRNSPAPPPIPKLPVGTFYLCPGGYSGPVQVRLYHAIRNGRQTQLDAAGVPKITAVEGQPVTFQFDMIQARDAVLSVTP